MTIFLLAKHNLLPDMHLPVVIFCVTTYHDAQLVRDVREVIGKLHM